MSRLASMGFTGMYRDGTSLRYPLGNGYRWYLPGLMRFNTLDSFSPFGPAGINAYAYCKGDPVNFRDPSGHIEEVASVLEEVARADRPISRERVSVAERPLSAVTSGNGGRRAIEDPLHRLRKELHERGYIDRVVRYSNEIRRGLAIEKEAVGIVRARIAAAVPSLNITLNELRENVSQLNDIMSVEYLKTAVSVDMARDDLGAAQALKLDKLGLAEVDELKHQIMRADVIQPQVMDEWKSVLAMARRVTQRLTEDPLSRSVGAFVDGGEPSPP